MAKILATKWEVKINGEERSIQLFDSNGEKLSANDDTTWGGDFYCYNNQLTSLAGAPKEVGGDFSCDNNQLTSEKGKPTTLTENNDAIKDLISGILLAKNILWADSIMSHIISSRNNVFKIRIYGKKEITYCVYRDGNFSHGKTIKEAIDSLRYKASARDTSEFKLWKLSDKKTISELISAYRSITGACEFGVRSFCESIKLQDKMTVADVVELTNERYGNDKFRKFEWRS